ncbi:MAG: hypothetical protein GX291_01610 [Tissierellia bacterium]|jgi:hypothetical protein|nr:FeoC-like transcriptional regulator [Bacillota bacterium]NLK57949.1 hypothetical protein [Tissierellia bacterium]
MLQTILQEIAKGGHGSKAALSRHLQLSENRLDGYVQNLIRAGYLKEEIPAGCEGGCSGCMRHCTDRMPVFYTLTDKGRAHLGQSL